ncbi:MAG TPA: hypothetical protein PKC87_04360, partial [Candidatus Absconditabacterales bacterium]|nr:hypothetical protein [Candidatus Absconditabacterales bacterium]
MKKGMWFVLLFILIVTGAIQVYKTINIQGGVVEVVRETKNVSLNDFLKQYTSGTFTKIVLEDETSLKGYQDMGTGNSLSLMSIKKNIVEQYV